MKLKKSVFFISLFGTLYAYSAVIYDFYNFLKFSNNLFVLKYGQLPNPVVTPCFWGAFAFFLCTVILYFLLIKPTDVNLAKFKYFIVLVCASTAFALGNLSLEFVKYFNAGGKTYVGCSGQTVSNPFLTPCFGGSAFFVLLLVFSIIFFKKINKKDKVTEVNT